MQSSVTRAFRQALNTLPIAVQEQAQKAYILWMQDSYHPSLQFKRVQPKPPIYSVRISLNYRALGLLDGERIYWYWIGTHDEYEQLLRRM